MCEVGTEIGDRHSKTNFEQTIEQNTEPARYFLHTSEFQAEYRAEIRASSMLVSAQLNFELEIELARSFSKHAEYRAERRTSSIFSTHQRIPS